MFYSINFVRIYKFGRCLREDVKMLSVELYFFLCDFGGRDRYFEFFVLTEIKFSRLYFFLSKSMTHIKT